MTPLDTFVLCTFLCVKLANKRKLFEKAQLKRQYAKVLKKEVAVADLSSSRDDEILGPDCYTARGAALQELQREVLPTCTMQMEARERDTAGQEYRHEKDTGARDRGREERGGPVREAGKRRRQGHRPDPFHEAKVWAMTCGRF